MNIQIKTTGGFSLTPAITDYVNKRFAFLDKFASQDASTGFCVVELSRTTQHHKNGDVYKTDAHYTAKGTDLYASSEKADLYASIDAVRDELTRELTTSKKKKLSLVRRGGARLKNMVKGMWGRGEQE